MSKILDIPIQPQPDDECGPSALHDILAFHKTDASIEELVSECSKDGFRFRDWDYRIGLAALRRGHACEVTTLVTSVFDPTWFDLDTETLLHKIDEQLRTYDAIDVGEQKEPAEFAYEHYVETERAELTAACDFLKEGGVIRFEPITVDLIEGYLQKEAPIIAGVNATLLHKRMRKEGMKDDEFRGSVWSHMLIVSGFNENSFHIHDPGPWYNKEQKYWKPKQWLIESITRRNQNIIAIFPSETPQG